MNPPERKPSYHHRKRRTYSLQPNFFHDKFLVISLIQFHAKVCVYVVKRENEIGLISHHSNRYMRKIFFTLLLHSFMVWHCDGIEKYAKYIASHL